MNSEADRRSVFNVSALAQEHLAAAAASPHGRSAHLFVHDGPLRQTIVALRSGSELSEHNAPPAATVHVLTGRVTMYGSNGSIELGPGDIGIVPQERHGVRALEDTVFLLTAGTSTPLGGRDWGIRKAATAAV